MSNPSVEEEGLVAQMVTNPIQSFDVQDDTTQQKQSFWKVLFKRKPKRKKEDDLNLVDNISRLLSSSSDITAEPVKNTVDHYINLQRIFENTNARKRLEKWAKRVISIYLLAILLLIIVAHIPLTKEYNLLKMSDTVIITILSTTTVNILGLGFIILKGHFPQNGGDDCKK